MKEVVDFESGSSDEEVTSIVEVHDRFSDENQLDNAEKNVDKVEKDSHQDKKESYKLKSGIEKMKFVECHLH